MCVCVCGTHHTYSLSLALSLYYSSVSTPYAHIDGRTRTRTHRNAHTRNPGDDREGGNRRAKRRGKWPKEEKKHWRGTACPSHPSFSLLRFFIEGTWGGRVRDADSYRVSYRGLVSFEKSYASNKRFETTRRWETTYCPDLAAGRTVLNPPTRESNGEFNQENPQISRI